MKRTLLFLRRKFLRRTRRSYRGQTLVEYAMIIAVLALVTVGLLYALSQQTGAMYSHINSAINSSLGSH